MRALKILYEDEHLLAADKPAGFSSMPSEDKQLPHSFYWDALHILQEQKGQRLYPAHRLDRATSGILLLSKQASASGLIQRQFQERTVEKAYIALVRGAFKGEADIDRPLKKEDGSSEEALTRVRELASFTLPISGPDGRDRHFTFLLAEPVTGRFHQIRRHLAGLGFPLVGDSRHGDKKLNRAFRDLTGIDRLLLRCMRLGFSHPVSQRKICLEARWNRDWHGIFDRAGVCPLGY